MSQSKFGHFLTGALVGAGLGILLAPKEGSKTREDLKKSFGELVDTIKNIDMEETKASLLTKVADLKSELAELDEEEVIDMVQEKTSMIEEKCDSIIKESKATSMPIVEKAAQDVKEKTTNLLQEVVDGMGRNKEEDSKNTSKSLKKESSKTIKKSGTKKKAPASKK